MERVTSIKLLYLYNLGQVTSSSSTGVSLSGPDPTIYQTITCLTSISTSPRQLFMETLLLSRQSLSLDICMHECQCPTQLSSDNKELHQHLKLDLNST